MFQIITVILFVISLIAIQKSTSKIGSTTIFFSKIMVSVSPSKQDRLNQLNTQLWQAGLAGMLKGTLIGLTSGYYFNYKYNYGHNARFFKTPYKIMYLVSWNIVGIIFSTDIAKIKISKDIAIEEELKRNEYMQEELNGKNKK